MLFGGPLSATESVAQRHMLWGGPRGWRHHRQACQPRLRIDVRPCQPCASGLNGSSSSSSSSAGALPQQQQELQQQEQRQQQQQLGTGHAPPTTHTRFVAETLLPTEQGKFRLRGYRHTMDGGKTFTEPTAIINGEVEGAEELALRVHDACFTSEVLGSLKCDCKEQLQLAMEYIQDNPPGMVIYLQQEGRGIGLANKIAAYALQEKGLDTVDANRALGLPDDCREYSPVRYILEELGIKSVRLMTNNPRKINELSQLGIKVTGRIPCLVKAQKYNHGYLRAKQRRMDHLIDSAQLSGDELALAAAAAAAEGDFDGELDGSFCWYDHEGEPGSAGIPLEPSFPANLDAVVVGGAQKGQQQDAE